MKFPSDLSALTSLRFFLAFGAVLFHSQAYWSWDAGRLTGFVERARFGMDALIILSGFVLTHAYRGDGEGAPFHYRRFLAARAARIFPVHLVCLAAVALMIGAARLVGFDADTGERTGSGVVSTVLLANAWTPGGTPEPASALSWLSSLWLAYLIFPLMAWLGFALRRQPWMLLGLALGLFVAIDTGYRTMLDADLRPEARVGVLRMVPEFIAGIALYRIGERMAPSPRVVVGSAALSLVGLFLAMHWGAPELVIIALLGLLILDVANLSKTGLAGVLGSSLGMSAGRVSFAFLMVHAPIVLGWEFLTLALGREGRQLSFGWEVAATLGLSVVMAIAVHKSVENPARGWFERRADRWWPSLPRFGAPHGSQPPDL